MVTRKPFLILLGILLISAWVLSSAIHAGAETLKYKFYTWASKAEMVPIPDVEGHNVSLNIRGAFYVFENGELATVNIVATGDTIKASGPFWQYVTIKFADGST